MKLQTLIKTARNAFHPIKLFCFIYSLWYACNAIEYTTNSKIFGLSIGTIIIALIYSGLWETLQNTLLGAKFDYMDILRSVIGGFIGYLTYLKFPNLPIIAIWGSLACLLVVIYSIYNGIKLMIARNK